MLKRKGQSSSPTDTTAEVGHKGGNKGDNRGDTLKPSSHCDRGRAATSEHESPAATSIFTVEQYPTSYLVQGVDSETFMAVTILKHTHTAFGQLFIIILYFKNTTRL